MGYKKPKWNKLSKSFIGSCQINHEGLEIYKQYKWLQIPGDLCVIPNIKSKWLIIIIIMLENKNVYIF